MTSSKLHQRKLLAGFKVHHLLRGQEAKDHARTSAIKKLKLKYSRIKRLKLIQPDDNYFIWKRHFLQFLLSKSKTDFVNGTFVIPEPSSPLYEPWKVCNARVKCWMMSCVSENLKDYVRFTDTAHKAWEDLRMMFVPSVALRIRQLRQRIDLMRQDGDSVARYFGKLKSVWMELSEYDTTLQLSERDIEVREKETLYAFLMGMNKDLSFVRTQITAMCPPPSLDQTYALAIQAESLMNSTR
ncbi:PREDICTED: uncharacterized protein LOC106344499 [Brassica oleracea var. oleracea]|uniref:uncharacterized protein LOC106344499 n=1 Tax=Brassica oleracea var. oleracea TaxID=109376 RepID=UPI0006A725C4|nr:PREDICTED: uncharacterized protein LOC106344499 [Brassica oleracea var. oleracea]